MPTRPFDSALSPIGALLPDFTVQLIDGRIVHRRDFKGRRHLVVCFASATAASLDGLVVTLAAVVPAWQAERAELLLFVPADGGVEEERGTGFIAEERGGQLRERFGVGPGAALYIADRYGEIVFHAAAEPEGIAELPLGEVLPILEQLEMRCSL